MEHVIYWLWLTTKFRVANAKITQLFERFDSIEDIYFSKSYNNIYGIGEKEKALLADKDTSKAERVLEQTARLRGKIIVYDDECYPELLKQMPDAPYVLYVIGKIPELDKVLTIGVVGTRRTTEYGTVVTERICRDLAKEGAVTISGLAAGIDAVGAWSTIEQGGIAVGVTGCGLDVVYPRENAELYTAMARQGCIMTEFPPGTPPARNNFPVRNRVIAGLSRGVLVTEAPASSGALITARYALENNRDVFAVPRDVTDTAYSGTNLLIQQGAKLVCGAEDILNEYPYARKIEPKKENAVKRKADEKRRDVKKDAPDAPKSVIKGERFGSLNDEEKNIVELLARGNMHIDEISRQTLIPAGDVNTKLVMLEMKGFVKRLPGGIYQIIV